MGKAAPRLCSRGHLAPPGQRCARCARAYDQARPGHRFYSSSAWKALARHVLEEEPMCGCGAPTTVADHVFPRRSHPSLELVRENIRGLCKRCHDSRTARDQGLGKR